LGQLIGLIVIIYLFVTYGFWNIVLSFIGISVAVMLLALVISGSTSISVQPKRRRQALKLGRRTTSLPLSVDDGVYGTIRTGLVIDEPWISKIILGEKVWEMRSKPTRKRERIALIRKGSLTIVGLATIAEVKGPFSDEQIAKHFENHQVPTHMIGKWRYAWVLHDVRMLHEPITYFHRKGAVTFVSLDSTASRAASAADAVAI